MITESDRQRYLENRKRYIDWRFQKFVGSFSTPPFAVDYANRSLTVMKRSKDPHGSIDSERTYYHLPPGATHFAKRLSIKAYGGIDPRIVRCDVSIEGENRKIAPGSLLTYSLDKTSGGLTVTNECLTERLTPQGVVTSKETIQLVYHKNELIRLGTEQFLVPFPVLATIQSSPGPEQMDLGGRTIAYQFDGKKLQVKGYANSDLETPLGSLEVPLRVSVVDLADILLPHPHLFAYWEDPKADDVIRRTDILALLGVKWERHTNFSAFTLPQLTSKQKEQLLKQRRMRRKKQLHPIWSFNS